MNDEKARSEAADVFRGLVDKIVLMPKENGTELAIDLHGDLAGILSITTGCGLPAGTCSPLANASSLAPKRSSEPPLTDDEIQQEKVGCGGRI